MKSGVARLHYSTDAEPGIVRVRAADGFAYRTARGRPVQGSRNLARIAALTIPPAWDDVWICNSPAGHLQATGKDARGRKQYRYHPLWVAEQDSNKFDSLTAFATSLPTIRRRVARDLAQPELSKTCVVAAIVRLMDRTFVRIGGERYRRENGSFGATTLRNRHVAIGVGGVVRLDFRGKSGKHHRIAIEDRRVVSVIRRCLDFPGQLFAYQENGEPRSVSAADVNAYLREVSGGPVTSKDFRTWGATVHAATLLARAPPEATRTARRSHVREAIRATARMLGNTPAVCRRSYIHPVVFTSHEAGTRATPRRIAGLRAAECAVLGLLAIASGSQRRGSQTPAALTSHDRPSTPRLEVDGNAKGRRGFPAGGDSSCAESGDRRAHGRAERGRHTAHAGLPRSALCPGTASDR